MTPHENVLIPSFVQWANGRALTSLAEMTSPPDRGAQILSHILAAERVWCCRILKQPVEIAVWPNLSLAHCESLITENSELLRDIMQTRSGELVVDYQNTKGEKFTNSCGEIFLHILSHGSYHRGQIAGLVKNFGGTPAETDFILFSRDLRKG